MDQQFLVKTAVVTCMSIFSICVVALMWLNILIFSRTGPVVNQKAGKKPSWGERQARGFIQLNRFFIDDEFRSLRRLMCMILTAAVLSFGSLILTVVLFDDPFHR